MLRIGIVGSGPAGFYTAQKLLKAFDKIKIDVFEQLPDPYGLIRYGVAPDHPEVKIGEDERFSFFGNVNVGKDVRLQQLSEYYHALILAYGAQLENSLGIDGETQNEKIIGSKRFVGWYNGNPQYEKSSISLEGVKNVVIIGNGNVALDCARMLLSPMDRLKYTDISRAALSELERSNVNNVHIVGRRGPLQVSFTTKEFREMITLPNVNYLLDDEQTFSSIIQSSKSVEKMSTERPLKRLVDLMKKQIKHANANKQWHLHFLKSIHEFKEGTAKFKHNVLAENGKLSSKNETSTIEADLIIKCIGYKVDTLDGISIPIDSKANAIVSHKTIVDSSILGHSNCALFTAGWCHTGPEGVLASTMMDAYNTAAEVIEHFKNVKLAPVPDIRNFLETRSIKSIKI